MIFSSPCLHKIFLSRASIFIDRRISILKLTFYKCIDLVCACRGATCLYTNKIEVQENKNKYHCDFFFQCSMCKLLYMLLFKYFCTKSGINMLPSPISLKITYRMTPCIPGVTDPLFCISALDLKDP